VDELEHPSSELTDPDDSESTHHLAQRCSQKKTFHSDYGNEDSEERRIGSIQFWEAGDPLKLLMHICGLVNVFRILL